MNTPAEIDEDRANDPLPVLIAIVVGAAMLAVTVVALRYPFSFTRQVTTDEIIRGMMSALSLSPVTAIILHASLRCSRSLFIASLLVSSLFAGLLVHEALFASKIPGKSYREPMLPRLVEVGVFLLPIAVAPAFLAVLPCLAFRKPTGLLKPKDAGQDTTPIR